MQVGALLGVTIVTGRSGERGTQADVQPRGLSEGMFPVSLINETWLSDDLRAVHTQTASAREREQTKRRTR